MLLLDLNCSPEFYWSEVDFFDVFTDFVDETISSYICSPFQIFGNLIFATWLDFRAVVFEI